MAQKRGAEIGASINQWAKISKDTAPELSEKLDEPRRVGHYGVEDLDLPRYRRITIGVSGFLQNPEKYFSALKSDTYYIYFIPATPKAKPKRFIDLKKEEVLKKVKQVFATKSKLHNEFILSEYFKNVFGGNIIIKPDGEIQMEMVKGEQAKVSSGKATINYILHRDSTTHKIEYSSPTGEPEDENIRELMYSILKQTPHDENEYQPGYYEFQVVQPETNGPLKPIFIDYRNNPAYYGPLPAKNPASKVEMFREAKKKQNNG